MLQIFLNGHEVKIKDGTSVKLMIENPLFSSGDQYTFDIELPLKIKQNRDFFGFLGRLDVEKRDLKYDARLMTNNITVITGEAIVTQITESSVKIQLLGHGAAYNYASKSDDRYIDELDLGDYASEIWGGSQHTGPALNAWQGQITAGGYMRAFQYPGKFENFVMYPIINTEANVISNGWIFQIEPGSVHKLMFRTELGLETDEPGSCKALSPQPYLWYMAKKIAAATGMSLADEDNILKNDGFFSRIFIANNSGYAQWNKALPHWTVGEWWQELENAFGIIQTCSGNRMTLRSRSSFYSDDSSRTYIHYVADEHSTEMDSEEDADISVCNVAFADYDSDPRLLLPEDVLNTAKKDYSFADIRAIADYWGSRENPQAWLDSVKNVLFCCKNGRQYIYWQDYPRYFQTKKDGPAIVEVNQYRPRIVNEDKDVEIELRFVPCRQVDYSPYVCEKSPIGSDSWIEQPDEEKHRTSKVRILSCPGRADISRLVLGEESQEVVLSEIIKGNEEAPDEDSEGEDLCYLGIDEDGNAGVIQINDSSIVAFPSGLYPYPQANEISSDILYCDSGVLAVRDSKYTLELNKTGAGMDIESATATAVQINTRVRHCINFISDFIPDVSGVFIIHNREYVCSKIEVNIAADGISKLITGYFYSIS